MSNRDPGPVYAALLVVWALAVAREKRQKLLQARRAANRGMIVVADRYPQNEIMAFNDGPLLPRLKAIPARLRQLEARVFEQAARLPPDLVIRLRVTPETAAIREPEMSPTVIRQRVLEVDQLKFAGSRIINVDAELPLPEVIQIVKAAIWDQL